MLRIIITSLSAVSLIVVLCRSQDRGTQSASLVGIRSIVPQDDWSVANNPAGLAELHRISFSSFLSPQEYGLPELRTIAACAVIPTQSGGIGVAVEQFGFDLYKETSILWGFGANLADGFRCGLGVRYRRLGIKGYGTDQSIVLQTGTVCDLSSNISFGFVATNITAATVGRRRERLPQGVEAGLRFESDEHFLVIAAMEKDVRYPAELKFGVRQRFLGIIDVSGGIADNPRRISAGLAVHYEWVIIGWAGYQHPELGWTHQLGLTLELKE